VNGKWRRAARKQFCHARFVLLLVLILVIEIGNRAARSGVRAHQFEFRVHAATPRPLRLPPRGGTSNR
jgi:hypothetical protein